MWNNDEKEKLYQAIFHRKSVRKYKSESLSPDVIEKIREKVDKLEPLFPEEKVAFRILASDQVKGRGTGQTYHLAVYAEESLKAFTNAGFMLQQMDLWFSSEGIGSWWHGLAQPINGNETADGLPFAFLVTFGIADEDVHRDADKFRRRSLNEITDLEDQADLLEAVRLAPSATNRQPWFIHGTDDGMVFYNNKNNAMITAVYKWITYLDAGIGLCHLWLAGLHGGKELTFTFEGSENRSKKSEYICTIR